MESTICQWWIDVQGLQSLIDLLIADGRDVVGPRLDQGAIVYDTIDRVDDLPRGWTDESAPGLYRIRKREDDAFFGFNVGPHSWKKYLFPPHLTVMRSHRVGDQWTMESPEAPPKRYAFLGVRACELHAIAIQDRVFLGEHATDPVYAQRRQDLFIIAVQCTQASDTCFCTSMNTGPECRSGYDLSLTEIEGGFVLDVGSEQGGHLRHRITQTPATEQQQQQAAQRRHRAREQMTRSLNTDGLRDHLLSHLNHPHWDTVAQKCLSCANCTMVCPTCFCHSVDEVHDLTDDAIRRERRWDSCFNSDFSHVAGGPVRATVRSRYRQWLTHKLATWIDQFGTSGCVGCGRCIAWCPVGIDLTREVAALREEVPS